jgi:hypothetical protein
MMLAWLAGLTLGVVWVWPHLSALVVTLDAVSAFVWLATGTSAWLVALNLGYRRFWRP